jgi:cyclopropane fatty-acyl-phospholipid synthase-like methyltransferase
MSNWNNLWSKGISSSWIEDKVWKLHHNEIFEIYQKILDKLEVKNPKVIELGCGSGELTARIIKKYGGKATLVDKSRNALLLSSKRFKKHRIKANLIEKDLLKFNTKKKFDIVHSEGLIEHFLGEEQKKIVEAHKKSVNKNGYIIISVPRPVWYYRMTKWLLEKINKWPFGFEKAMNKNQLKEVLKRCDLKVLQTFEYRRYSFALAKI